MIGILEAAQIEQLLTAEWIGRIGCHARGRTYVVPVTYAYDGVAIYGQTGVGQKVQMMRERPQVCFEVDRSPTIASWESVILHGRYEELVDDDAAAVVERLRARQHALVTADGALPPRGAGRFDVTTEDAGPRLEVIYRIVVEERSGRYERP